MSAVALCRQSVRQLDYELYLCGRMLPTSQQPAFWAIRAWSIELARKKTHGLWEDSLRNPHLFKGHPIGEAMHSHVLRSDSQFYLARRLLKARQIDAQRSCFWTSLELQEWAEECHAVPLYMQLKCAQVESLPIDHVASHVGRALGCVSILRGIPKAKQLGLDPGIPMDLLKDGQEEKAIDKIALMAHQHLEHAQMHFAKLKPEERKASGLIFMVALPAMRYLQRDGDGWLAWQLWWKSRRHGHPF